MSVLGGKSAIRSCIIEYFKALMSDCAIPVCGLFELQHWSATQISGQQLKSDIPLGSTLLDKYVTSSEYWDTSPLNIADQLLYVCNIALILVTGWLSCMWAQ